MYTIVELKNLSQSELQEELNDARRELYQERTSQAIGQSKTPHKKKILKKYITHILTVLSNQTS